MVVTLFQPYGPDRSYRINDRASAEKLRGLSFSGYRIDADNWHDKMSIEEYVRTQILEPGVNRDSVE